MDIRKNKEETEEQSNISLGKRVKDLRNSRGLSQRQLADIAGLSFSAISKIENNQLSPTYDSLTKLSKGLRCDIIDLFEESRPQISLSRRSTTRHGQGAIYKTNNYHYELLCNDITHKKMTPLRVTIKTRELQEFGSLSHHEGEEFIFVLSGTVEIHTEFYQPETLNSGDCIYFDSTMKHACLNTGETDAVVFWICSSPDVEQHLQK